MDTTDTQHGRPYHEAFEVSPVPVPGPDAVAPEPFRGIYGMPQFVTVTTTDLAASVEFWTRGLGFFELFGVPGRLVHLRRWAFQDVLLVPDRTDDLGTPATSTGPVPSADTARITVSIAHVLSELDAVVERCTALAPGSAKPPVDTPWNTRDVVVTTPEGVRVVCTAAKPFAPDSVAAGNLAAMGITPPDSHGDTGSAADDNGTRA